MARILSCGSPLRVPAPARELAEDDEVAPVVGHDLPVAAAQRAVRPPAVLDEPRLAHSLDGPAGDRLGPPAGAGADLDGPRRGEAARAAARPSPIAPHGSHGASVCRRSGTRESGSTGTMRSAASGPATARAWRTASRSRAARTGAGPETTALGGRGGARGPPTRGRGRRGGAGGRPGRGARASRIR